MAKKHHHREEPVVTAEVPQDLSVLCSVVFSAIVELHPAIAQGAACECDLEQAVEEIVAGAADEGHPLDREFVLLICLCVAKGLLES